LPGNPVKKFSFGLETLLNYRITIEEKERLALSRLILKMQTERKERDRLRAKRDETMAERTRMRGAKENDADAYWYNTYVDRLESQIKKCGERMAQIQKELDAQKTVVISARKNRKVLDTLKAKKAKEHTAAVEKLEQKTVDEIVITRYANRES
jgi:flagellar FliJ protein